MKKTISIIILILVVAAVIFAVKYLNPQKSAVQNEFANSVNNNEETTDNNLVGGDKDKYGCIGSAGYSWCEQKQKCLRIWEEVCDEETTNEIKQLFAEKYHKDLSAIKVVVGQQTASHLRGSVQFAMNGEFVEGGIVLAAKVVNEWQLVFDGNGGIACSLVELYNFPKEMTEDCYR